MVSEDPKDRRIRELEEQLAIALERLDKALKRIAELEEQLALNSKTSSKPPSSDTPDKDARKKPKKDNKRKRRRGAQPGHEPHTFKPLQAHQAQSFQSEDAIPDRCQNCQATLRGRDPNPKVLQTIELPEFLPQVRQALIHALWCSNCGCKTSAKVPEGFGKSPYGPRLCAFVAVLATNYRLSKRLIQQLLDQAFGLSLSLGTICNLNQRTAKALEGPYEALCAHAQQQPVAHMDETGWFEKHKRAWMWTMVTNLVCVFRVSAHRSAEAAKALLEGFCGTLISDRYGAYTFYEGTLRQVCFAHLVRDFARFVLRGGESQELGEALLSQTARLFRYWRRFVSGQLSRADLIERSGRVRSRILSLLRSGQSCGESKTEGTCSEILKVEQSLFTFIYCEGVEPTNNEAERAIRPAVLLRKLTFGTNSALGSRFVERMLTVLETARRQGRDALEFITQVLKAHRAGAAPPSLVPQT